VPLGGAVFAAEVLYGSFSLPVVLPALACSLIATAVGWIYLANGATYGDIPSYQFSGTLMAFSLVGGLVIGVLAVLHVRIIGWVSHHRIRGPWLMVAMPVAFAIVGSLAIFYPALLGNGKDMAHEAFLGTTGLSLLIALACLKPLATSLSLGSGAAGGVFTPFLAIGAVSGGALGVLWTHLWPGSPSGAFAIVGAAAMIGAAMQAPLAGLVLVLELTHIGFSIVIPMMTATIIATWLVRQVDGYSIYSARLPQRLPDRKD